MLCWKCVFVHWKDPYLVEITTKELNNRKVSTFIGRRVERRAKEPDGLLTHAASNPRPDHLEHLSSQLHL